MFDLMMALEVNSGGEIHSILFQEAFKSVMTLTSIHLIAVEKCTEWVCFFLLL